MASNLKPYLLKPGEGVQGFDASVKASGNATGGQFTLIESHTKGGAPMHVHTREDEYLYIIKGKVIVNCGGEIFDAEPGAFVFLPRNIPHSWDVGPDGPATLLMMTVPAMLEDFLSQFHAAPTRDDKFRVAEKFGIKFL